jgi:hypothetical protein
MKTQFFGFLSFAFCSAAFSQPVTNEVLFVNEKGETNRPETLATTAQMAANKAAILTAEQKAAAAEAAAREGTNLVRDLIRDITANELVIYRYGYTDAFGVAVTLDPNAELVISEFQPLDTLDGEGRQGFRMVYRLHNTQSVAVKPTVKWGASLEGGRESFAALPSAQVAEPIAKGIETDADGKDWWAYELTFYAPQGSSGFYVINLSADDASGDGWVFDLPNGVKGGRTGTVQFGSQTLEFVGGLCVVK